MTIFGNHVVLYPVVLICIGIRVFQWTTSTLHQQTRSACSPSGSGVGHQPSHHLLAHITDPTVIAYSICLPYYYLRQDSWFISHLLFHQARRWSIRSSFDQYSTTAWLRAGGQRFRKHRLDYISYTTLNCVYDLRYATLIYFNIFRSSDQFWTFDTLSCVIIVFS